MSNVVFQAAVLRAGKQGIIKPDANGYYTQCIGGLDIENAAGVVYASDRAKNLFSQSSDLQRRIRDRALRGECGHPRRGPEHDTDLKWIARLNDVIEKNISVYWSKIELDPSYGKNNPHLNRPNMMGIIGTFRPGGFGGAALEKDLSDPLCNVAFSIRSFSIPFTQMGRKFYDLQSIVTWDQVTEPGLEPATKMLSASMESRAEEIISMRALKGAVEASNAQAAANDTPGALRVSNESKDNMMQLIQNIQIDSGVSKPVSIYYKW